MNRISCACIVAMLAIPGVVAAQDERPESAYAYATYFVCQPDGESRADEIIRSSFKPHYDAAVEHGDILSWSWLQHYVGGNWRRVLVIIAKDMDSLLDASGALGEIISDKTPEAGRAFSAVCNAHEDYIWQAVDGVGGGPLTTDRGKASLSVYLKCDMAREEQADAIFRETLAPIYNRHVREGELISWNYLQHNIGGKWRRLLTMGAADQKTLMRARAAILEEFGDRRTERAVRELNEICGEHQDYLWDTLQQTP